MGKKVIRCIQDVEEFLEGVLNKLNGLQDRISSLNNEVSEVSQLVEEKITELTDAFYEEKEGKNS